MPLPLLWGKAVVWSSACEQHARVPTCVRQGRVGYTGTLAPCRWGIGKVVCDCVRAGRR